MIIDHEYDGAALSDTGYPKIPFAYEKKVQPCCKAKPVRAQHARAAMSLPQLACF